MIRDAATQRQVDAANPQVSTWLAANAGSGKTRVLTDRVARLLLDDVSPQNILCLTYTKAAAAEMQNRLFKRLGAWAMMQDDALRADLRNLGVDRAIDAEQLRAARTLFARAIETPGGLKIQTIHSFCAGVLRRFPLEAGVSPQFREMEDRAAQLLRAEVMDQLVQGDAADVVQHLLTLFTGDDLGKLTAEVTRHKDAFLRDADIAGTLGLGDSPRREEAFAIAFTGEEAYIAAQMAELFADQSATYKNLSRELQALDLKNPDWPVLETLFKKLLYADYQSKSRNFPQSNHGKAVEAMAPIAEAVHDWMDRVAAAKQHLFAMDAYDRTCALYAFGRAFVPAYEARKLAMGALDFDDLINKARALLTDTAVAQWVLFRLDGGIDHVLVDEAQDTSPAQWDVIEKLTQEFAAGAGSRPNRERTVFVVGDKKQSIYSFQGADPAAFDKMKLHFRNAHAAIEKTFEITSLDHSFRSSQAILSVVDATFTGDQAAGMEDALSHIAFKDQMPGRVDLWPVIEPTKTEDNRPWYEPVDQPGDADHHVQMAQRIADQISHMIAHETIPVEVGNTGTYERRRISAGDFLILVQRRSELFSEIIRACKSAGLNVAGADRLRVGAELAVKDLAALLSFLALAEDDLSLASALRSPLFGWSEQELFTLAHHRPEKGYLWEALRGSQHHETLAMLHDLRDKADFLRPYDLIARILIRHDGRRKLLARLGAEAEDGIDALLSQALAYESTGVPSLTGFLTWMQTDDLEVKRQMDSQGDKIRVMTVHGAKGLEAPIVILPETMKRRNDYKGEILPAGDAVIWKTPSAGSAAAVVDLREAALAKQEEERLRLLYVAMTRAEKWLIIGASGDVGDGMESWYNIAAKGIKDCRGTPALSGDLEVIRVSHLDWDAAALTETPVAPARDITLPEFGAVPDIVAAKTLSPSDLPGAKALPGDIIGDEEDAKARGTLIHLLLEHLPLAAPAERAALGQTLAPDETGLMTDVIALLDAPDLAHLWGAEALVEVPITADLPNIGRIHGAIDRLILTDGAVLAVDYKSNRLVPDSAAQIPLGVLRQQAIYHAALAQVFPDRQINVAILWTATAQLMALPADLLHETMTGISLP
ncbi:MULTISPECIES: double-strand break repair helicase AddA [unclassified Yoonia]|uniref:double-strand break repair helicase AddA n=1 Tax=unclassified Yoonia TaxID=2629118 RepID=UPI002AFF0D23|nr:MULTISPECIES: double-strand break repair helicase AddA [unclassified Yoonia]